MNCNEIQAQLTEYLDRVLDSESAKRVGLHLEECHDCRIGYAKLLECIEQVKSLPVIDPPLGFAQRVMAHAAEIELRPTLWQRIVAPWQGRAPVQAFAVVVIAVLAVFIYQKDDRFQRTGVAQLTSKDATSQREVVESEPVVDGSAAQAMAPTNASVSGEAQPAVTKPSRRVEAEQSKVAAAPTARQTISTINSGDAPPPARRTPIPVQEVTTGRSGPRLPDNTAGFGGFPFGAARQSMLPFVPNASGVTSSAISEPTADIEFVVRRRAAQRQEQRGGAADTAGRVEADPPSTSESTRHDHPSATLPSAPSAVEVRWFSVAPEHLEQFRKELGVEAIIESEAAALKRDKEIAARFDRTFAIKVVILPPAQR